MHLRSFTIALLGLSISVSAMPQPVVEAGHLSLPLHRRGTPVNYSPDVTIEKRGTVSGSAAASNGDSSDFHYWSPFNVGGSAFQVKIDTGSTNFLAPDPTYTHATYTPTATADLKLPPFNVTYGDSSWVAGKYYADKVIFGSQTVTSATIGAATATSSPTHPIPPDEPFSGLVGLGYASSFWNSFKSSVSLASNVFTLTLRQDATGWLDFGWVNPNRYTGPLTYIPLGNSANLWTVVPDNSWAINGTIQTGAVATYVLFDSGTSIWKVPTSVFNKYISTISGAVQVGRSYQFPCSHVRNNTLPSLGISMGGTMITVPGSWMWNEKVDSKSDLCWGVLAAVDSQPPAVVLGDMWHRTKFVVHDQANSRVGVATQAGLPAGRSPYPSAP